MLIQNYTFGKENEIRKNLQLVPRTEEETRVLSPKKCIP